MSNSHAGEALPNTAAQAVYPPGTPRLVTTPARRSEATSGSIAAPSRWKLTRTRGFLLTAWGVLPHVLGETPRTDSDRARTGAYK